MSGRGTVELKVENVLLLDLRGTGSISSSSDCKESAESKRLCRLFPTISFLLGLGDWVDSLAEAVTFFHLFSAFSNFPEDIGVRLTSIFFGKWDWEHSLDKAVAFFHFVTEFSKFKLREEEGRLWLVSKPLVTWRCKRCSFFFRNNLSSELFSFSKRRDCFLRVSWLMAFRMSKVLLVFFDRSTGGSSWFAFILLVVNFTSLRRLELFHCIWHKLKTLTH